MEATAQQPQFKRQVRNYLLDKRFQLSWVLKVAIATAVIVSVLGYFLYGTVAAATDQMVAAQMNAEGLTPQSVDAFIEAGEKEKLVTIIWLVSVLFGLVVLLSLVTIVLTHKIAGPVYKLKKLLSSIDGEHLQLWAKLRKGDELQDMFEAFDEMVRRLREARHHDIDTLERVRDQLGDVANAEAATRTIDMLLEQYRASVRME